MRTEVLGEVKKEIEKMLKAGFIRPCRYVEWISSIVPVPTPKDEYPMPVAEMLINAVAGNKILSFTGGNTGYNQIFKATEDIHKTAF
jgi:hypothetical protein